MGRDSFAGTLLVALVLCVACSLLVSSAAVLLNQRQVANKRLYEKTNILIAAGLADTSAKPEEVNEVYEKRVKRLLIDLDEGTVVPTSEVDYDTFDPRAAASDPKTSEEITTEGPTPGVDRRAKMAFAYEILAEGSDSEVDQYVLPIYGKGLWSTIYGFISLDSDAKTVKGITFYDHGETPGLGGEVENPLWQGKWLGKLARNEEHDVVITVAKGSAPTSGPAADYTIDGLSGATITTRGVSNFVQYWLGPGGFGPFLDKQTAAN
ncbi:Na(+)-translocating NADH-quinone reductase subunit C [Aeoliella sp. SH292]|uniref:Na(+)-translocating NADH-quinone reductase subunit C n=1 Tax=Aeoliella sp. SH292 TaxID=3454464 RepID=UPI003F96DB82